MTEHTSSKKSDFRRSVSTGETLEGNKLERGEPVMPAFGYLFRQSLHHKGDLILVKYWSKDGKLYDMNGKEIPRGATEIVPYDISKIWFPFNENVDHWMQSMYPDIKNVGIASSSAAAHTEPIIPGITAVASAVASIHNLAEVSVMPGQDFFPVSAKYAASNQGTVFTRMSGDFSSDMRIPVHPKFNILGQIIKIGDTEGEQFRQYILQLEKMHVISPEEKESLDEYATKFAKHLSSIPSPERRFHAAAFAATINAEAMHAAGEQRFVQIINDRLLSIFNYFMDERVVEQRDEEGGVRIQSRFSQATPSVAAAAAAEPLGGNEQMRQQPEQQFFVDEHTTDEAMNTVPQGTGIKTRKTNKRRKRGEKEQTRRKKEQTRRKREQTRRRDQLKKKRRTYKF